MSAPDSANWFQPFGYCTKAGCGKPATGTVLGTRNEELGKYCKPHGEARIRDAQRERQRQPQ